jgi:hypothetical protein
MKAPRLVQRQIHLDYHTSPLVPGVGEDFDARGFARTIKALHREGIRAPLYISVLFDEYAASTHPEWVARSPEGGVIGGGPRGACTARLLWSPCRSPRTGTASA